MYDLERVEIWEPFACGYQFIHLRARTPSRVRYNSRSCGLVGVEWIRVDDGELSELWTRGHIFGDWRQSVIVLILW